MIRWRIRIGDWVGWILPPHHKTDPSPPFKFNTAHLPQMVLSTAVATPPLPPTTIHRHRITPPRCAAITPPLIRLRIGRYRSPTRLNAGLTEIEPDLVEDKHDPYRTNGVDPEDFIYGEYDGHHTYYEGQEGSFWEAVVEEYNAAEPPTGFQGWMSWLFLPAIVAGLAYNVPGEYLYVGAGIFIIIFCAIEMGKPDKPHNFEPQIYNLERGVRDKLISEYNTMDIWDFNEKYGELWDFTVKGENIIEKLK